MVQVVEVLDELEHARTGLGQGHKGRPVEELAVGRGERPRSERVVARPRITRLSARTWLHSRSDRQSERLTAPILVRLSGNYLFLLDNKGRPYERL